MTRLNHVPTLLAMSVALCVVHCAGPRPPAPPAPAA